MEQKYLYSYLQYKKTHDKNTWKKLMQIPWYIICLILTSFATLIMSVILYIAACNNLLVFAIEIVAIILTIIAYILAEHYNTTNSKIALDDFAKSRVNFNCWLKSVHLENKENKTLMLSRLQDTIAKIEMEKKNTIERWDKWLQILFIPIVLAIITSVISNQRDMSAVIAITMAILIWFGGIYGMLVIIKSIYDLPNKTKLVQLQSFANELQSTLDMEQFGWYSSEE